MIATKRERTGDKRSRDGEAGEVEAVRNDSIRIGIHGQALKAGAPKSESVKETQEFEADAVLNVEVPPVRSRYTQRRKSWQHEVPQNVPKHVLDRRQEWPKKFVDEALHQVDQPVVENVRDAEARSGEAKIDAAPFREKIVNRLQQVDERFQGQAVDDPQVP